jgi:NADPH-dependent glutamate synthase beta subunit-like oxidoreductase
VEYKIEKSTAYYVPGDAVELKVLAEEQKLSAPIVAVRTKEGLISTVDICQVEMMLQLMRYAAYENCGYCGLGRIGTETMYRMLQDTFAGRSDDRQGGADKLALLEILGNVILKGALCSFCQMAAQMVLESLQEHRDHYEAHIGQGHRCRSYEYHIIHFTNCQIACPLKTDVAFFFQSLVTENIREGKSYLELTNLFPQILSGVCGYCKGNCTFKKAQGKPLPIEQIKGYLCNVPISEVVHSPTASVSDRVSFKITNSLHKGRYQETDKTIGIIGAGPAGLAAAIYLAQMGYRATVFDAEPAWGGTMRTGIPGYRLDNDTLNQHVRARLDSPIIGSTPDDPGPGIKYKDRISFSFNTKITARNFHQLLDGFDRLIVASGTFKNRSMGIPGEDVNLGGMVDPLLLMKQVNTEGGLKAIKPKTKVIVIGGGNVAIDCAREAKRIGCDTWIYYRRTPEEMPADEEEYHEALNEGVRFAFKMWPKEIKSRKGRVTQMVFTDKTDPDNPKDVKVTVDYIVTAVGQLPDLDFFPKDLNLKVERGNLVIDEFLRTSNKKIYIAGDLSWKQPKLVCKAIHEGIEAAIAIDREFRPERYTDPGQPIIRQLVEIARLLYQEKDPYQEIYGEDITKCGVTPPSQRISPNTLRRTVKDIVSSCLKCKQFVIGVVEN